MAKTSKNTDNIFLSSKVDTRLRIELLAPLTLKNAKAYESSLHIKKMLDGVEHITIVCDKVKEYDTFFVVIVNSIQKAAKKKDIDVKLDGMDSKLASFYDILNRRLELDTKLAQRDSFWYRYFHQVGLHTIVLLNDARNFIEFVGDLILSFLKILIKPNLVRWRDFPFHFSRTGVNAVPIVLLIVFLIGLITGYQGALQLAQFGADKYIADLIGISITRELSPLMVAILVAGRSGSAFAAEIGTMKVGEEIDALGSMGFDITMFLVLPRVLAVTLAMPILTLLCNVAGIGGGLIAALTTLDITVSGYLNQLQLALSYTDIFSGLFKSVIFGFLIATVGCFRGLQVSGGAESVGKYTTASVVSGVFLIIFSDAIFTFIFQFLGI